MLSLRKRKRDINHLMHGRIYSILFVWRSREEQAWLDIVPVGREFGSKDFERLMELDSQDDATNGRSEQRTRIAKAAPDNPELPPQMVRDTLRSLD